MTSSDTTTFVTQALEPVHMRAAAGWMKDEGWWPDHSLAQLMDAMQARVCFGVFDPAWMNEAPEMRGFASLITDWKDATLICDLIVQRSKRGCGYGTQLMNAIVNNQKLRRTQIILGTKYAVNFYYGFGFQLPHSVMMFRPPSPV